MAITMDTLASLVAQAEDAGATAEERQAFLEKAEQFAARLGVELAVARSHRANKERREEPIEDRWEVGWRDSSFRADRHNPYLMRLFLAIAHSHDLKCTVSKSNVYAWTYGMPSDHEIVEKLWQVA